MKLQKPIQLLTGDAALQYFFNLLVERNEVVHNVSKFNHDRHVLVKVLPAWQNGVLMQKRYYVVYKKEKGFYTFAKLFPAFVGINPEFSGEGESINKEVLDELLNYNEPSEGDTFQEIKEIDLKLVFIYPDGMTRWVRPAFFKKFAEKNNLIRTQNRMNYYKKDDYSGFDEPQQETTFSIPVSLLQEGF